MNLEILMLLRALLGEVVLLPVPSGEKGCKLKGWPDLTLAASKHCLHQRAVLASGNIGVLLGPASGHLVTVDCDTDDGLAQFLTLNPALRESLITRGARGGNVWLRMAGEYPQRTRTLGDGGHWGEFRSGGAQTIIAGTHPDGHVYTILQEAVPLTVDFPDLQWPPDAAPARGWHHEPPTLPVPARPSADGASPGEADSEGTKAQEGESSPSSLHLSTSLHALHPSTSLHLYIFRRKVHTRAREPFGSSRSLRMSTRTLPRPPTASSRASFLW